MKSREVERDVKRGGYNAMVAVALETYFPHLAAKK